MLKKIIRTLAGSILLFATVMPLLADWSFSQRMKVVVPFDFVARNKTLPAGDYIVSLHPENGTVLLQGLGQMDETVIVTSIPMDKLRVQDRSELVFVKSGATMALREIWSRGSATGQVIPLQSDAKAKEAKKRVVIAIP